MIDPATIQALREKAKAARETGALDEGLNLIGVAKCMACHHEWCAAWPAEMDGSLLQCPKCRTLSGRGHAIVGG